MEKCSYSIPGVDEDRDACLQMARDARIESTYLVTAPHSRSTNTLHLSRSLSTAFELWNVEHGRRLSVVFDWAVGDASGSGIVRYEKESDPIVQQKFLEGTLRNMIIREIADSLFEDIPQLDDLQIDLLAA